MRMSVSGDALFAPLEDDQLSLSGSASSASRVTVGISESICSISTKRVAQVPSRAVTVA